MAKCISVAIIVLIGVHGHRAEAACAGPSTTVLPAAGAELPPNPVLFLFLPETRKVPEVRALAENGDVLPHELERLSASDELASYRVALTARAGTRFRLTVGDWSGGYVVSGTWGRPARQSVQVSKVETENTKWTCSHQKTQNLTLRATAPAYRVDWAASVESYRRGERLSIVLPSRMDTFWSRWADKPIAIEGQLELGFVNCFGATLEWGAEPIFVGISALYSDGSVDLPAADPMKLDPPKGDPVER